jgi:hypothetical protein
MMEQSPEMKKRKRAEEENKEAKPRPDTETARPISDLREQAGKIKKNVLAFCLDPSKKVNKEQTATIMRYFKDMAKIVEDLLLHNSYLTGMLEQSTGAKTKETQILTALNQTLQTSKRLETAVKKTARTKQKKPSYAEKVKMKSNKVGQIAVKPPKNVVIIGPEASDGNIKSSEQAREAVFTLVNPRRKGIQVTAVKKISGNHLVVETTKQEGLKAFTEDAKLKEAGLKASTPQRKLPRVILYEVPREMQEKELLACMRKQN